MPFDITKVADLPTQAFPVPTPDTSVVAGNGALYCHGATGRHGFYHEVYRTFDGASWGLDYSDPLGDGFVSLSAFAGGVYYTLALGATLAFAVNRGSGWVRSTMANSYTVFATPDGAFLRRRGSTGAYFWSRSDDDGATWSAEGPSTANGSAPQYDGVGTYVAVPFTTTAYTSPDGVTWTAHAAALPENAITVAYGNGLFIANANSSSSSTCYTSPDGVAWTARALPRTGGWGVPQWNGTAFCMSDGAGDVVYSTDGVTWNGLDHPGASTASNPVRGQLTMRGTTFVLQRAETVYLSNNGSAWTEYTLPHPGAWSFHHTTGAKTFATWASLAGVAVSTNLIDWTIPTEEHAVAHEGALIASDGDMLVLLAPTSDGRGYTYRSFDGGLSWQRSTPLPASALHYAGTTPMWGALLYSPTLGWMVGGYNKKTFLTSPDALVWTERSGVPTPYFGWQWAVSPDGKFCAVDAVGTGYIYSDDGLAFTSAPIASGSLGAQNYGPAKIGNKLWVVVNAQLLSSPDGVTFTFERSVGASNRYLVASNNIGVVTNETGFVIRNNADEAATAPEVGSFFGFTCAYTDGFFGFDSTFVGDATQYRLISSEDGATFSYQPVDNLFSVAKVGAQYIGVSEESAYTLAYRDPDWTAITAPAANLQAGAYFNGIWLWGGYGTPMLQRSTNGVDFTEVTTAPASAFGVMALCATDTGFCGMFDTSGGVLMATSPDGLTWTEQAPGGVLFTYGEALAYGNGILVAWGNSTGGYSCSYSTDGGQTWASVPDPLARSGWAYARIAFNGEAFCVCANDTRVLVSTDGANWTVVETPLSGTYAVGAIGGQFFLNDYAGDGSLWRSDDGLAWTVIDGAIGVYVEVFGGADNVLAGVEWGGSNAFVTTDSGATWQVESLPQGPTGSDDDWYSSFGGGGLLLTASYQSDWGAARAYAVASAGFWAGLVGCMEA